MTGLRDAMRTSDELRSKVAQQAAVASLGRLALDGADPYMLMRFAMESVPETLCTDFASVLEALPDGRFLARADSGWSPALAGRAIVAPQAAYCLHTAAPVIADEFLADERFRGAEAPEDYGDRSGISVPLHVRGEPYGVLNAYSAEVRAFTPDDLHFLQSVANVLAGALERRRTEEAIQEQALRDPLTCLANRSLFTTRLAAALARLPAQGSSVTVLFIGVDRFGLVNDTMGHAAGDELLVQLGGRLLRAVRASDTLARFGGDQFVVLGEWVSGDGSDGVASRISEIAKTPFELGGEPVFVDLSIGIARTSGGDEDAERVLASADAAMHHAKERGGSRTELFDESLRTRASSRLGTANELRAALEGNQLVIHYQPLVHLGSGGIYGVEALVRWMHPERGLVPPADFIPVAEKTGLIIPLGAWVLEEAARQVESWRGRARSEGLGLSVNLSARQLGQPDLVERVEQALESTGFEPCLLTLEVTESALMEEEATAVSVLARLRELGVRVAIDDFGAGYSSLSYLSRLPADELKIDRAFVGALTEGIRNSTIVGAVVSLAGSLGLVSVAEGVETEEQLVELQKLGCDAGQGFLFGRPLPPEQLESLVLNNSPLATFDTQRGITP